MNKKAFFVAMAIVLIAGCSYEMGQETQGTELLIVRLDNVVTRAVENQIATGTVATLSNVEVFLLNGVTVVYQTSFTSMEMTAMYKRIEQAPGNVDKVVVMANIPAADLAAVKALTTYAAIVNYPFTIASQNAGLGTINDKTVIGEGTPTITSDPTPDSHLYKSVFINLKSITARFEVGTVIPGNGVASVELVGMWINNFYTDGSKNSVILNTMSSPYWVTTPSTHTSPTTAPFGTVTTVAYNPPEYKNIASSSVTTSPSSMVYTFHVFAGTTIPHLLLLVKGEYSPGYYTDDAKYFLGWITFTAFNSGGGGYVYSIEPGTIYRISNIPVNTEPVTIDPQLEDYDCGIIVTVEPWVVVYVTPVV